MHFFGADLRFGPQFYRRDAAAYLAEFEAGGEGRVLGESSVWYLCSERAAAEIKVFSPEARIIILLREPVEMLHSLYYQFRFDGNEHLPTFEQALAAEEERRAGKLVSRQNYFPQGLLYREAVRYAEQVERYFAVFGPDRVHVILYDDLAADAAAVYRDALRFLGLEVIEFPTSIAVINGNKVVKHPVLKAVLNEPLLRSTVLALRPWLPRALFSVLQRTEARLEKLNARRAARQRLDPEVRRRLKEEFAPGVVKLGRLLGRDLSDWSADGSGRADLETREVTPKLATFAGAPAAQIVDAPVKT